MTVWSAIPIVARHTRHVREGHHVECSGAEIRIAKQDYVPTIAVACMQSRTVLAETGSGGAATQATVGNAQATVSIAQITVTMLV